MAETEAMRIKRIRKLANERGLLDIISRLNPGAVTRPRIMLPGYEGWQPAEVALPYEHEEIEYRVPVKEKKPTGVNKLLDLLGRIWEGVFEERLQEAAGEKVKAVREF